MEKPSTGGKKPVGTDWKFQRADANKKKKRKKGETGGRKRQPRRIF